MGAEDHVGKEVIKLEILIIEIQSATVACCS